MRTDTRPASGSAQCARLCLALLLLHVQAGAGEPSTARHGEWRSYGNDPASTKYTPLDQISRENVSKLRILWRRPGLDPRLREVQPDLNPHPYFRPTPLMIDGVLYAANAIGSVEAFDPGTGSTLWVQEPPEQGFREPAGLTTRTVAFWSGGSERRILAARGDYLVSMDAKTGRLDCKFGDGGKVDLSR